ncbi:MAG TPA: thiamine pyrophosphate-binding protein [Thermomicrobiales bacterium]|nr:thiamine pyrophosphate-binding protein [Thermomicrobiales bacterium]HQZ89475.1 thiamine pyrophosphate-binding protein [Thermomicrobiales bacterium]HRA31556.1 thiamine pyrophosphate-binding protein [Thermomicrobiales bacterium]
MSEQVTGGSAAIAAIEAAGVDVVFGIPGVHTLALYDGLHGRKIRHILARHEQGAGFMADGYARATGKPGVALIITGPGITNVATAVGEAYADSSPVVVISSQVEREYAGKMRGNLHDLRDQSGLMGIVTKQSTKVHEHRDIAGQVYGAIQASTAGRPRPVHVEVPLDVLAEVGPFAEPELHPTYRATPTVETVEKAAAALASARRPIIYVGGGASDASEPITALAEILGAPVLCSIMGKGVVADDNPYSLGHAWDPWGRENPADSLLAEADLVLVIGSKLGAQETNFWQMPFPERMIRVDVDPSEINLNYPNPEIGIIADARATAESLLAALNNAGDIAPRWSPDEVAEVRERITETRRDPQFGGYIDAMREALPREGIIVHDMTMMSYLMGDSFPVYAPRTYMFPANYGTLGFSVPAAIGAKIGRPDVSVVAVVGDGGFQFTMQEVATAIQFEVTVPIVIFNDSTYTAVDSAMKHSFSGQAMATELVNPDYVKLADAYGIPGVRANSPEELRDAVVAAFERRGPTIIDVPIPRSS